MSANKGVENEKNTAVTDRRYKQFFHTFPMTGAVCPERVSNHTALAHHAT
jgi:hypothetical protein